jgi:methionyl-tRNA formyltransferase
MVTRDALRIVFMGTPAFAVPTLDALLATRHSVVGVVTQPDRPRGRGQKTSDAPVKQRAAQAGVPVLQPDRLKAPEFLYALEAMRADLGVVAAYGKILNDAVLQTPRLGMINVHASILPRYRGAAPVHRAVIAGEHETGVTIMRVVKELDAGPMLLVARRPIGPDETSVDVEADLARIGAALLVEAVDRVAAGIATEEPQDASRATYAPRLTKEDGRIDWSRRAAEIHNLIRGLHPWPHAYTFVDDKRLILLRSQAAADSGGEPPGTVITARGDDLRVAAAAGTLRILELQAEGRRPMTARDFLAGHPLAPGSRFSSSASF